MLSPRCLRNALRPLIATGLLALASCISTGSNLTDYDIEDIRPPERKFAVAYSTNYGNYSYWTSSQANVGVGGSSTLSQEARRIFDETGFFSAATENAAPTGLSLLIRNGESAEDCMWGIFLTSFTLFIIPGPITFYHHTLDAELRRDGTLLRTFHYKEKAAMWFGLVCFPSFLMGQPFEAGAEIVDKLLLNLLHDLGEPSTLQLIEGTGPRP